MVTGIPESTSPHRQTGGSFVRALQRQFAMPRGLVMHVFFSAVAGVDLLILNLLTNRDTIWAVWPIGILAIVLAAHIGFSTIKPGVFGMHLVGGAAICGGLAIINIFHGRDDASLGDWWVIWPILAWFLSLVIHLPFAFDLISATRQQPTRIDPGGSVGSVGSDRNAGDSGDR